MSKKHIQLISFVLALLLLIFSGCAQKQWRDPLDEKEDEKLRAVLLNEQDQLKNCPSCLDAEITAVWESQLYDGGITGYLQVMLPNSIKLVAINFLGQPLFAITTNGQEFQTINAVKGVYKHGRLSSFVNRHSLPSGLLQGNWSTWFTGRMEFTEDQLTELRRDVSSRGVWLTLEKQRQETIFKEYLLYDTQSRRILERIPMSNEGNELARIIYTSWTTIDGCPFPTALNIQGVSFGTDMSIELSEILVDKTFDPENFSLKLPPGYLRQYYP